MWNLLTGRSSESYKASPSGIARRKDNDQRSAQQPSESLVSPKSAGKPPRGDDRDGSRRFKPTSTSYSSTSRSSYPGTASVSIASSYATASNGQTDGAVIHPDVVRDASLADQLPKSRPSHKDRDQDRARERKSERRRSSSRDRKRDRDSKRWDRKGERDKVDKGGGMDRGLTRSGSGYAEEMSTPRTGETFAHASGSFNAQVGSSGFTQFPGQYDGGMPGFASGPPPLHESMSAHVQDQFPGQFPLESTAPYRPPLAASEGGPGLAADYYGDAGESVTSQPGVRPQPLGPIIGTEPHLQPASHIAQPPPEPSSAGGVGAAASFYSGVDLPSTLPSQPSMTSKPPKTGKPSKFSSSGSFSGSAALAGSAVLGYTAGTTGEASYTQGSGNNGSAYYQQGSGRPPSSATGTAAYSSTSAPASNGYYASSAPVLPTLGAAAAGAAAGYMMGSHSSAQQQPSGHSGYSPSATQRPTQFGDHFIGTSVSSRPPRPAKYSPQSSSLSFHSAGQSNAMAQKHRHRTGPLGTFVEFWTDPDGVAQYEEYTEYIGVCKNCFAPGSTPRDAPRKHHYRRRRSDERYGSSTRVDKESRWGSSDGENRRRSRKSWLAGGIAGYGIAEVGKTLFNQKRGADDIYNVRFSRGNASNTSLRRRSGSDSPSRRSRTSYGVTGGSSASISRRRSRSGEHVETGITSDGKIYRKDPHGSLLGGPAIKTYTPRLRSRSRSRSRSRDRHNGHAAAALGATPGSTVVASQSRRRDRSSDKASVRFHHRSRERSPRRGEVSMLSGFFSSPPEKRQRSHRKKKRGFFSFGNSSSSSADADLAFGAGIEVSRDRKRLSTRSRNDRNADAAFLGLSAAAAAIALRESQKGSKSSRKADVVAVKETKSKKRVSSENRHRGRRTSASPIMEEDGWESASDEDDSSSVNSALAYGGHARRSQESLTSDSSGMGKWGWRWGNKKKSKRTVQAGSTADNFGTNAGTTAATLAGAIAGGAVASNTWQWQNDSRMSSSSNLPPLQQVYPVPTSDPSRFDVTRHDSIASSNQPLMTSRPAPVPLQQPQPIVPVSHTVYTTQPPYSHSYSAPSGPPVFSQITYQPQPSNVGDSRDTSSGPTQTNVPGSFPGGGMVADNAPSDARTEFSHQRRETFPITKTVEPELDPLPRRQRASTRDESSAARFDFSEEPKGEDLYDWRRRQVDPDQRREEIQVQDAHQRRQVDHGSMSSNGVSMRRTEYTSEPAGNMDRKGDSHLNRGEDESKRRKPVSRVVPVDTRMVGAAISAAASEVAHVGAGTHQEERREDDRKDRIEKREDPADDEPRYSSGEGTGAPNSVEQHVQITPRVLSRSVKNLDHENYAAYFIPREFLFESNDGRQSTEVQGDNDVTTDQIPQIIAVEPKGSGLSFIPAHTHTDEVDLDHISLPWQVPRLNLIEPTPPHSIAGSTKGGTSPVIKPEDAIEETKETPGSSTTPKVTWGKDETHTYQVVTPLENPEEFISTSTMLHNEEEDIETSSEASPLDDSPIIVERVPRRMPGDFGDDLEFAATVAAGLEDTGFNPAIVIDDATFRRRDSPPGSEATGFYRSPFAETSIDLGLDSPGTEGAPPKGELPPTPKYEQGPNANGGNADVTASKPSKDSKSRKKVAEHDGDDDIPGAFDTKSELHDQRGVSDDPGRYSAQQQRRVSVPVNVFDYLDEGSRVEDSKGKASEKSDDGLEITSSGSPGPADVARSEYFDAPEAAAEVLKSSSSSRGFDDVTVDVPAAEQPVGDFQEPNRADKRKKKSRKSEQDGQTFGSPAASPGSTALERNGDISSKRKSDRKSPRRDSERYSPSDRDLRSVMSDPVSEKDREEGKSRSRDNLDNNNLYDSPFEDARPTPAYAPIEDEFDEPRKSKKKSKRGSSGYGDISASVSPSAAVEDKRDSKSKSKKNKKGGLFGIFSASKSSDKLSETAQAQDAAAETTSDTYEEPKRKNKKSKERRSTRNGDGVSTQASDRLMEDVPVPGLLEEVDVEGNPDDFEDANAKRKKSKDRKTNHTYDDWYGPADQSSSNLSRKENDDDGGKSRRKEYKRRSQESDLVEESGRVTQALQAKVYKAASPGRFLIFMLNQVLMSPEDRDLPSIRKAPTINAPNVVDSNAGSGENEKIPFLEERQTTPPPPDIRIPADPHSHYADKSVENFRPCKVEHETEASQFTGISGAPSTPPSAAFPLEDLPPLPASRPASPAPVSEDHMRRTSVIQASDSPQNHLVNSSPTAIPLHFRRPPASPGPARSSPFASPTTPNQRALDSVPPQRRSRPNSTEFKSSTEFRPLWLVERHGSRQEIATVESYPSLPSSHTTSRSSSVHDPDEVGSHFYRDDGLSDSHAVSDGEDSGLRIDVSRSLEREDLLGSRQATPTAASFHLDTKDNVLTEKMQDSGQAETSASREHSAKEAIRGVFPSSPKRLSYSVGGDLPERYVLSPISFEALEDLPPLPTSRSSSPSLEGYVQETSATPEEAEKIEELPFLPLSRSSSPLHDVQGRKPTLTSEEAEQLEELPPLPASRSSSPLHDSQRRDISSLSKEAEHLEELPPLPASRSSSPLQDSQQRGIHSVSGEATQVEELPRLLVGRSSSPLHDSQIGGISSLSEKAEQLEELPPLPASRSSSPLHGSQVIGIRSEPEEVEQVEELSTLLLDRSSSPLHDIQGRKATSASEEAEQLEKLPPLPVSRSSSPLHDSQRRGISSVSDEPEQLEELPSLPANRSSSLSLKHETLDTSPMPKDAAVGAIVGLAAVSAAVAVVNNNKAAAGDSLPETDANLASVVDEPTGLREDGPQTSNTPKILAESEVLSTQNSKKDGKGRKASSSRRKDDLPVDDETVARSLKDQDVGDTVMEEHHDVQEDGQDGPDVWFTPSTSKKTKKERKGKRKGRGGGASSTPLHSLTSLEVEASSVEESRAVSPSGALTVGDSPGPDIITPGQTPEVAQDDWPGSATGSRKSKGKKGKKKLARSGQEETIEPGAIELDTVLEGPPETLESQRPTADYGEHNPRNPPLSDADVGVTDPTGQSTKEVARELVSDSGEAEPLVATNQEGEKTKEPVLLEDKPVPDRAPTLQQPLDIVGQEFQSPSNKLHSVKDFSETRNAVLTPQGNLDEEFFTPMGMSQSTQETEAKTEFPFPTGRGKASKKAKKKRKTVALANYLEPLDSPLESEEPEEFSATRSMSGGNQAEEAGESMGATSITSNSASEPAVALAYATIRSSDGGYHPKAASPTFQGLSAITVAPEATPLPVDDDLDLLKAPPANSNNRIPSPEVVSSPLDEDFVLIEAPQASLADRLMSREGIRQPTNEDFDLTEAPQANPAQQLLAPEAVPLPRDEDLDLAEAPRASPAQELLALAAVPLPRDEGLDLAEAPRANLAQQLLAPEAVPLAKDEGSGLIEAPQARPADRLLTLEAVPLPRDSDVDLIEASHPSSAVHFLAPEAVPLPTDEDPELVEAPPAAEELLTPSVVPLPRDNGHGLIKTSSASLAGHFLTPEAVPLPINGDLPVIFRPVGSADSLSTPESISSSSHEDPGLTEALRASLADRSSKPESLPLPIDKDFPLNTPSADLADKLSTPEAEPLPAEEGPDMMVRVSPASFADHSLAPEALAPRIDADLDLIEPAASSADRFMTSEAMSLPIEEDINLMNALPEKRAERFLSAEAVPLPTDEDLDLIEPAASSADRFLTSEATPLPTDKDSDRMKTLPEKRAERFLSAEAVPLPIDEDLDLIEPVASSADRFLTSEAMPLPIDEDINLMKAPLESPAERILSPEAVPLPIDEDLDLLYALPASPVLQTSRITSRESGSAPDYSSRSITEKDQALTLLPSTPADEADELVLDRASGNTTLERDNFSDELAVTQPMPELGYNQQAPSPALAFVIGDVPAVHDSSPSANVVGSFDRSPTQEVAEDFSTVISQKKVKKGKKGNQISSIIPDLGPTSVESDSPVIATEPGTASVDRALGTATPQEQINEDEWDVPSTKKKGKQGKKDKYGFQEPGKASQEDVISADLLDHRTVSIKDTQSADTVKDLTNPPELGENLGVPEPGEKEPSFAWEPFQKKSETRTQQSPSGDSALTVGETEESPGISGNSLAATDTGKAVREMLADTGRTPNFGTFPPETDAANPFLIGIKPKQMILENPSTSEDHLIRAITSKESSIEAKENEVSTPTVSVPDNLPAFEAKLASTSTAIEVQRMLGDRGSPRPSDDRSRKDDPLSTTQSLKEPPYEDEDTWDIPVKKKGKKGKKSRSLQGPESTTEESSILPTPTVEPETAPSNKDAMVEAAENFTFKKSKKEKKGKKKVLGQASSSYQDEGKAEVGVMSEIDKGPGKENTLEQSYFDRATHPTEVQELSLPPQTLSEDLLEYAASVPLPLDEVGDKATDVVAVKRVQESDVAWSRAVDVTESEVTPIDSSRSQQLSTSLPDAQSIADRSRELSALGIPDPTAIQTAPMIEITRTSTIEDDSTVLPTEKIGKKAKRQQRKQLEQERVDTAEYKPLPTSVLPEVPANKEELESSFPVNRTASEGRFSPETGAASRDALRELELEDGVSYFSLTSVESSKDDRKQSKYHGTAFADEGDQSAVHGGQPTNHEVLHTAPHESTLATIVEQPDYVDPVALGHDADSQLADQGASNQKNFSQLFVSTSKEVESNVGPMEFGTGSHSLEESESRGPHIDDAPVREKPQLLATTDSSIVYPPGDSLSIGHLASGSAPKSVAEREYTALPSNGNVFTSTTSRKSKKGKKGKKTQELLRDDDTAPPATPDPEEAPIENLEAPPLQPSFETPEPGTSYSYTEKLPAEQREYEPSIEATLPTSRGYAAPEERLTADRADEDLGYSMKKMKQQADLAQGIEEQPQLEKIAERDAAASSVDPVGVEQQQLDKIDIPRKLQEPQEPQESQQSDLHMLAQHVDPRLMAKDGEHTPVPIIELYQQTHSTIQDSLPSGIAQKPIPVADISEITKDRQIEHEHATAHFDHPQEVTATNKENQDDSGDFPTTKKPKKSKKSKKQSPRLDIDTKPQEVQPESSVDPLHQHTSTISHDQPLSIRRPEVSKSASPPQVTGHGGDGQFVGAGALAAIGSGVAAALLHNKSEGKGTKSKNQGEDRQLIAHEVERMESPSLHDEVAQPSEGSFPLSNAIQHRIPAQSLLYDDTRSSLPQFPAENEQRQDIARPSVPTFQCDDDAKRDSAVQMSDSPVISERLQTYDVVRDSGYQGTESSPPVGTDPEFIDASGTKHHSEIVERPSTLARHEEAKTLEQIGGYEDNASYNAENPLNISIEVDPTYEVAISRHKTKRYSGRVKSNFQDGNFDKNVSPYTNSSRAMDLETPVQYFDESPQPSPADSATKDKSSVLFQSSPSTREERTNQPIQPDTLHAPHSKIDPIDMSPAYNDNRGNLFGPDMSPSMATHEGASILAARASSLAALSGLTDAHRDSPKSLFGGPVGINSDLPSVISPPRTPFSLENSGRRQLNTITEHSPEESLHHKQARALSDIGSPERGTKSGRRSVTPREISQRRVRSPTVTGTIEKSLISTDDVLARLSWPAVDEDKHSVDLERSRSRNTDRRPSSRHSNVSALVSDGVKQRESEHRSVSGASIRSGESINAIIRTPEQFRSVSALSNRSGTPPLRRVDTRSVSGDLRAASKRGEAAKPAESEAEAEAAPAPAPAPAFSLATPSSSTYDPVKDKGKSRVKEMADIYEGWGDVHNNGSPLSPTRPPSMRRRQSMQIMDLESKVDQLVSENRLLQDAKSRAERGLEDAHHDHVQKSSAFEGAIETRDAYLTQKNTELGDLRRMVQSLQNEVSRLTEVNRSLETAREVDAEYAQRYTELQAEHSDTHEQWQQSRRELEDLRSQHSQLSTGMEGIVRHEVSIALEEKNAELARLREELEEAKEQVRTLQRQILASKPSDNFLIDRDEDYFDTQCQQLCQRVQQWVLRFSKLSDMKASRLMGDIDDEKVLDRLDNTILDGSDVDNFLADRVKRRDVFMSMVMTMIWEYVFTRYLFGMDREQRQKLKALEKNLAEVGPMTAVHKWRATTLTLLSKRGAFVAQRSQDSEAVVQEIYGTLSMFLPPPSHLEIQIRESLRNVMKAAIDLSIEMRTQRAEYVMLPPLQPEYNTHGDLARKVYFNASMMNERSGDTSSNEELEAQKAVVRMVLFPLVVKKDDASGIGEKIVVCPAQVLVAKPGKDKKVVRVVSGDRMDIDRAGNRSVQSFAPSSMDMGMGNMI